MSKALLIFFLTLFSVCFAEIFAQTWTQLENYPGLGRDDAVAFSIADCGYILTGNHAGFSESNDMWKYNTTTNQWLKVADFPGEKRQYALSFTNEEFAYILGGISENNIPLNDFYSYNSIYDSWQKLDSFPGLPRWSAAGTVYQKSAYLFGGTTLTTGLNDSWRYDFNLEVWENLESVPSIGKRDQLCFTIGEKIYLSTGFSINPTIFHSETYSYNVSTLEWKNEVDFPSQAIGYGAVANSNNKAIILGGLRSGENYSDEAWQFNISDSWTKISTCLSNGTKGMSAFSINDKYYFLTGKKDDFTLSKDFYVLSFENKNEVQIYPNPSKEEINFTGPIGSKIEIFNSLGENILNHTFDFSNNTFYTFKEIGIYLVRITYLDQKIETKKVVIL